MDKWHRRGCYSDTCSIIMVVTYPCRILKDGRGPRRSHRTPHDPHRSAQKGFFRALMCGRGRDDLPGCSTTHSSLHRGAHGVTLDATRRGPEANDARQYPACWKAVRHPREGAVCQRKVLMNGPDPCMGHTTPIIL